LANGGNTLFPVDRIYWPGVTFFTFSTGNRDKIGVLNGKLANEIPYFSGKMNKK
jgi:hypothetical protein